MRRSLVLVVTLGLLMAAVPLLAQDFEPHPHALVLGVEIDEFGEPTSFRKCVDLAANEALPLNAQHQHVHFGTAASVRTPTSSSRWHRSRPPSTSPCRGATARNSSRSSSGADEPRWPPCLPASAGAGPDWRSCVGPRPGPGGNDARTRLIARSHGTRSASPS